MIKAAMIENRTETNYSESINGETINGVQVFTSGTWDKGLIKKGS